VKIYYDKRLAVVVFENTMVDIQQLSEAIEEIGFFPALGGVRTQ
jgi:copper chaperone CopZ